MPKTDAEFLAFMRRQAGMTEPENRDAILRLIGMVERQSARIVSQADEWRKDYNTCATQRSAAIARAEAAESAQREGIAEVARLREALRTIRDEGSGWAVSVAIGALTKETAHD